MPSAPAGDSRFSDKEGERLLQGDRNE